jgi:hypothetical protein
LAKPSVTSTTFECDKPLLVKQTRYVPRGFAQERPVSRGFLGKSLLRVPATWQIARIAQAGEISSKGRVGGYSFPNRELPFLFGGHSGSFARNSAFRSRPSGAGMSLRISGSHKGIRSCPHSVLMRRFVWSKPLNLWHSPDMATTSKQICNGSGKASLLGHVDEPDGRGTCGACRQTVQFELVNGIMVPTEHWKPAKPKRRKKLPPASKSRNPASGRNRSRR